MKTKEQGWVKGSFEIDLAYEDNTKLIENGRIYKYFGLDMSSHRRELYHLPSKTTIGIYELTLKEIKEMIDELLKVDIDWSSSDKLYFMNIDRAIVSQIDKIRLSYYDR